MTNILKKFLLNLSYELSDEVMVMWGMKYIMVYSGVAPSENYVSVNYKIQKRNGSNNSVQ